MNKVCIQRNNHLTVTDLPLLTCKTIDSYSVGMIETFPAVALVLVQDKSVTTDRQTLRREDQRQK